jgi:hypothetical protein
MYKLTKEQRDAVINVIANAKHDKYSYGEIANLLNQLQQLEEEDKKVNKK